MMEYGNKIPDIELNTRMEQIVKHALFPMSCSSCQIEYRCDDIRLLICGSLNDLAEINAEMVSVSYGFS